jgi:hypothetical protein
MEELEQSVKKLKVADYYTKDLINNVKETGTTGLNLKPDYDFPIKILDSMIEV